MTAQLHETHISLSYGKRRSVGVIIDPPDEPIVFIATDTLGEPNDLLDATPVSKGQAR